MWETTKVISRTIKIRLASNNKYSNVSQEKVYLKIKVYFMKYDDLNKTLMTFI